MGNFTHQSLKNTQNNFRKVIPNVDKTGKSAHFAGLLKVWLLLAKHFDMIVRFAERRAVARGNVARAKTFGHGRCPEGNRSFAQLAVHAKR